MIVISIAVITVINTWLLPELLVPIAATLVFMGLMAKEFGVGQWLKRHPLLYMTSHMIVMPLIDLYNTALDWLLAGVSAPNGIEIFLVVSFFNGMVIEIGRKIRAEEAEERGVDTYSALFGEARAAGLWTIAVVATFAAAVLAALQLQYGLLSLSLLAVLLPASLIPAWIFAGRPTVAGGKRIETMSGVWTIGMYLILGTTPIVLGYARS